ncbi:hypothetical protein BC628DRAFT_154677 [Trametes gibbosa]|nr:hypothetical protein BC628DRAFT_154677 [Trametes gibbosa]
MVQFQSFVSPYPPTHWCEVPAEKNVIHNSLCRPLPRDNFPPPPPEPSPVVGTPEWLEWKKRQNAPPPMTAWTRGTVPSPAATTNGGATTAAASPPASRTSSNSSSSSSSRRATVAWGNPTIPLTPPGLPVIVRGSSSSGSSHRSVTGSAWGGPPSQRSVESLDDTLSIPSSEEVPPILSNPLGDAAAAGIRVEGAFAELSVDDYEDGLYYSAIGPVDHAPPGAPGREFDVLLAPHAKTVFVVNASGGAPPSAKDRSAADVEDDDDDDEIAHKTEGTATTKFLCPEHNIVCRTGICLVYAKRKRELDREAVRQQREKDRAAAQKKREKNAKKKNKLAEGEPVMPDESGSTTPDEGGTTTLPSPSPPPRKREPPPHLRKTVPPGPARALPAHLGAGAPPPSPGPARQMPSRLMHGPSGPGGLASLRPDAKGDQDAQSEASSWGNLSDDPWVGPRASLSPAAISSSTQNSSPAVPRAWGVWGKAPSISASSVQRNNDSWSVSAGDQNGKKVEIDKPAAGKNAGKGKGKNKSTPKPAGKPVHKASPATQPVQGNWGKAPSISGSTVQRNYDSWSVSARSVTGWGVEGARSDVASDDGNWGRPLSVVGDSDNHRMWADEMDEEDEYQANARQQTQAVDDDTRSVAASTEVGWASGISAGPCKCAVESLTVRTIVFHIFVLLIC